MTVRLQIPAPGRDPVANRPRKLEPAAARCALGGARRDNGMASRTELIEAFRTQSRACTELGSPFMASLLEGAAGELERTGDIAGLLASWPSDPVADAVPLRL